MSDLKELQKEFLEVQSQSEMYLERLRGESKGRAVRKVISKGGVVNFRPFELQRAGFEFGKVVKEIPKNIKNTHVYYYDGNDKIIHVEVYGQTERVINNDFYFYGAEYIKSIHFSSGGGLRNIRLSEFSGAEFVRDLNVGKFGMSISEYAYESGVLKSILVSQKESMEAEFSLYTTVFNYAGGELSYIGNHFPNGYVEDRYP
ncbi:hypothetical protein [Pseudomonas fluorescens]|jgi:hypothetical protein|uniref:hypothetical protein n=1 Tax=Pseudomonas fluorescens TaxID=294 RepID=UPI000FB1642D|nr:hypothetical protein [Pseudomonas fluorescens]